jgi:hypothetical protein
MFRKASQHIRHRQAGFAARTFQVSTIGLVGLRLGSTAAGLGILVIALLVAVVVVLVLLPAVWSRKRYRREAALAVLDRLIRWR